MSAPRTIILGAALGLAAGAAVLARDAGPAATPPLGTEYKPGTEPADSAGIMPAGPVSREREGTYDETTADELPAGAEITFARVGADPVHRAAVAKTRALPEQIVTCES